MSDITPSAVSELLVERAEDFVKWLLPDGKKIANDWCVGSTKGEPGNSCKICIVGENTGAWADFAVGDKKGDLLDLLAVVRGIGLGPAIREACEWLGVERTDWTSKKRHTYVEPERPKNARPIAKAPLVEAWLATRKISPETCAKYKLCADGDDVLVFPYMRDGKLLHVKYRTVREKKFWSSAGTERGLFGWQALNSTIRSVILTEGEMDCLALAEYGMQSLSIPIGAGKGDKQDWIENEWENLERFDTIYLAMDADEAGKVAVDDLVERLGRHRCKVITLPRKDANECLMNGVPREEMFKAVQAAKNLDPEELRNSKDFAEEVYERFHPPSRDRQGFLMPWIAMSESFFFEWGATTIFAGFAGHGKSELCGQIVLDAIRQGVRCCVASLEFKSSKWIQRQVRQATCEELPDRKNIEAAMDWLGEGLWAVDVYGAAKTERILRVFSYAHRRYGIKLFVIDNWSKLGIADDDLAAQKKAVSDITEFSVTHNVHTIIVNHLRKEDTDTAIAASGKLGIKGSGSIADLVDNIFMVWRNRPKEGKMRDPKFSSLTEDEQNKIKYGPDTVVRTEKYRSGDDEPRLNLYFDKKSHTWVDSLGGLPSRYVDPV